MDGRPPGRRFAVIRIRQAVSWTQAWATFSGRQRLQSNCVWAMRGLLGMIRRVGRSRGLWSGSPALTEKGPGGKARFRTLHMKTGGVAKAGSGPRGGGQLFHRGVRKHLHQDMPREKKAAELRSGAGPTSAG